jgi:hypothetical protein
VTVWQLEFGAPGAISGVVRLEQGESSVFVAYSTVLRGVPGVDGIVVVDDREVPRPRQGLEIRTEGLWAELVCETPGEHWTFGLEVFGLIVEDEADEIGERVPVGLDLEWEVGDAGAPSGLVHGDVLVGRERFPIEVSGVFSEGDLDRDH